jgi:hypothetical protein
VCLLPKRQDKPRPRLTRIQWAQRNRQVPSPAPIGSIAGDLLESGLFSGPAWRRRLLAVLQERAEGLLEQVEVLGVQRGVLKLSVQEPALAYCLRLQWEQPLIALLRAELPESGIHAIRFTVRKHTRL